MGSTGAHEHLGGGGVCRPRRRRGASTPRAGSRACSPSLIIGLLGVGVAARILSNQIASTQAHRATARGAGREGDRARRGRRGARARARSERNPARVRRAPPPRVRDRRGRHRGARRSRSGDPRRTVRSATWSGSRARSIEGEPWSALAASVSGADAGVRRAARGRTGADPTGRRPGAATWSRGSRRCPRTRPASWCSCATCRPPRSPTRRSARCSSSSRTATRTARRLLRRTNAAIEAERNRVARDLHDGPVQGVSRGVALARGRAADDQGGRDRSRASRSSRRSARNSPERPTRSAG